MKIFQAYHSSFIENNSSIKLKPIGNMVLLPIRTQFRGPAPLYSGNEMDIIDEAIYFFKANVFFRTYEIKVSIHTLCNKIIKIKIYIFVWLLEYGKLHIAAYYVCNNVRHLNSLIPERGRQSIDLHNSVHNWVSEKIAKMRHAAASNKWDELSSTFQVWYSWRSGFSAQLCLRQTEQTWRGWLVHELSLKFYFQQVFCDIIYDDAYWFMFTIDLMRQYLKQIRHETGVRLVEKVYGEDGKPSKWWLCFAKKKFMDKSLSGPGQWEMSLCKTTRNNEKKNKQINLWIPMSNIYFNCVRIIVNFVCQVCVKLWLLIFFPITRIRDDDFFFMWTALLIRNKFISRLNTISALTKLDLLCPVYLQLIIWMNQFFIVSESFNFIIRYPDNFSMNNSWHKREKWIKQSWTMELVWESSLAVLNVNVIVLLDDD